MTQDELFAAYYVQYRTQADTPNNQDDEYTIFIGLANEAINRWANYDGTFWSQLYGTLLTSGDGDSAIVAGNTDGYATPGDMRKAGGFVHVYNTDGATIGRIRIIQPEEVQFQSDLSQYAYFVGNPNSGFTLFLNASPVEWDGYQFQYVYYRNPTVFELPSNNVNAPIITPDMSQPYFIVHRALANRFRGSRNPYYQSAKTDAEDVLATMKMEEISGNWADPWRLADRSSGRFGA